MAFIQAPAFIGGDIVEIGKKKGTECPSMSVVLTTLYSSAMK